MHVVDIRYRERAEGKEKSCTLDVSDRRIRSTHRNCIATLCESRGCGIRAVASLPFSDKLRERRDVLRSDRRHKRRRWIAPRSSSTVESRSREERRVAAFHKFSPDSQYNKQSSYLDTDLSFIRRNENSSFRVVVRYLATARYRIYSDVPRYVDR